jgi:CheY-specific phosphatase CheX
MVVEDEILEIAQSIWMSILDLPIELADCSRESMKALNTRTLTGCVHLTGEWDGAVLLYCTEELAGRAASIMFATDVAELSVEEIQDALGELTNMTAGNIKPLLSGNSRLSLPSVVEGLDYNLIVPGSRVFREVGLTCENSPMVISLLQRAQPAAG